MQRHQAGLAKLGVHDRQDSMLQVNVLELQIESLADTQASNRQQAE
jgi:hypothetical protein